jgi:hypothetical protein
MVAKRGVIKITLRMVRTPSGKPRGNVSFIPFSGRYTKRYSSYHKSRREHDPFAGERAAVQTRPQEHRCGRLPAPECSEIPSSRISFYPKGHDRGPGQKVSQNSAYCADQDTVAALFATHFEIDHIVQI